MVMMEVRTHQSGRLEDVSPLDLLQSLGIYRRAGHVVFLHAYGRSQLWFEAGAIIDAQSGALRGAAALYRIATHERGEYQLEVTGEPHDRTIERSGPGMIFEAARRLDEGQRLRERLPAPEAVLVRAEGAELQGATEDHARVAALLEAGGTLGEVLERSALGELETLEWVAELVEAGKLIPTGEVRSPADGGLVEPTPWQLGLEHPSQSFIVSPAHATHDRPTAGPPRRRRWLPASVGAALTTALTFLGVRGYVEGSTMEGSTAPMVDARPAAVIGATIPSLAAPQSHERTLAVGAVATVEVPASHGEPVTVASRSVAPAEKGKARRQPSRPARTAAEPASAPLPEPRAEPVVPPADAASLLAEARRAYAAGQGATAYRLAARSKKLRASGEAAEVMTLAACQEQRPDAAADALRGVPLVRRSHVRSACRRAHGVRLGLGRSGR
jgi:hypothetical protein